MIIHILLSALLSIAAIPTKGQDNLSYAVDRIDKNLTKRANVVVRIIKKAVIKYITSI